jgi:hypothetical protein
MRTKMIGHMIVSFIIYAFKKIDMSENALFFAAQVNLFLNENVFYKFH